jgi:hypothetical protein
MRIACYRWVQLRLEAEGETLAEAISNEIHNRNVTETLNNTMGDPEYYVVADDGTREILMDDAEVNVVLDALREQPEVR